MMWIHGYGSVIGEDHIKSGLPCQDNAVSKIIKTRSSGEILLAGVSDGAGSAKLSDKGASIVLDSFLEMAQAWIKQQGDIDPFNFYQNWFEHCRHCIDFEATNSGNEFRDYAATAILAIVWEKQAAFLQIGDGCIVVDIKDDALEEDFPSWVFWNDRLDVEVNLTTFVTSDDALSSAQCELYDVSIKHLALFTDGIEHGVMHNKTQSAHKNFFDRCFNPLKSRNDSDGISTALEQMLLSPAISSFSNDDKSLVLAVKNDPTISKQSQQGNTPRHKLYQKRG